MLNYIKKDRIAIGFLNENYAVDHENNKIDMEQVSSQLMNQNVDVTTKMKSSFTSKLHPQSKLNYFFARVVKLSLIVGLIFGVLSVVFGSVYLTGKLLGVFWLELFWVFSIISLKLYVIHGLIIPAVGFVLGVLTSKWQGLFKTVGSALK